MRNPVVSLNLLFAISLAFSGLANAQKVRSGDELYDLIEKRDAKFWVTKKNKKGDYETLVFGDWTAAELELASTQDRFREFSSRIMRRWATLDPKSALKHIESLEKKNAKFLERSSYELEGGRAGNFSAELGNQLEIVLGVWSQREPRKIWAMVRDREGFLENSTPFRHYASYIAKAVLKNLSKADPGYAINQIFEQKDRLWKERMLVAFCETSPKGQDWLAILNGILKDPSGGERMEPILREKLIGRWMEDDAEEASAWFHENASKVLSIELRRYAKNANSLDMEVSIKKVTPSLGEAVGFWFRRSPESALAWILSNEAQIQKDPVFPPAFVDQFSPELRKVRTNIATLKSQEERSKFALMLGLSLFGFDNDPYDGNLDEREAPDKAQLNVISMEIGKMNLDRKSAASLYRTCAELKPSPDE